MTKRRLTNEETEARPLYVDALLLVLAGIVFLTLVKLGNWQMGRLHWKLGLIEQVETRAYGTPVAIPAADPLPEYLRVIASGEFRHDLSLRIKAVTDIGPGYWIMTPLLSQESAIWVNRGFAPTGYDPAELEQPLGTQDIVGLARLSRPDGTLLEQNDAEANRWFSADLPAMNSAVGLGAREKFFIDAERTSAPGIWPQGGLTIVEFRNNHLSYALTWYAMAALFLVAMIYVIHSRRKASQAPD